MTIASELRRLLLRPEAPPCFAVLDGARREQVHTATLNFDRYDYLIDGVDDPALIRYAPRVVELGRTPGPGFEFLIERGFGDSWGYFVHSGAAFRDLREHLASVLDVRLPDGRELRFRLFDPRVLRGYLPTCTPDELAAVFGPISRFWVEADESEGPDESSARLLELGRGEDGTLTTIVHELGIEPPLLTRA